MKLNVTILGDDIVAKDSSNWLIKALRALLFAQIYHSPRTFTPRSRNNRGGHEWIALLQNYVDIIHPLKFDLNANHYLPNSDIPANAQIFDAYMIKPHGQDNYHNPDSTYAIYVCGNSTSAEMTIPEMINRYQKHQQQVWVIGFNPPGVGSSPGVPEDFKDYCLALHAIINNLSRNGVRKIVVIGHSLGGCIAAKVVADCQLEGKNVRLFADRTMTSISDAVASKMQSLVPNGLLRAVLGNLLAFVAKTMIWLCGLELDVVNHFRIINSKNPGSAIAMGTHGDEAVEEFCLSKGLELSLLPYFKKFMLKPSEKLPYSHCTAHDQLITEDGNVNAEQYLHEFILKCQKSPALS